MPQDWKQLRSVNKKIGVTVLTPATPFCFIFYRLIDVDLSVARMHSIDLTVARGYQREASS